MDWKIMVVDDDLLVRRVIRLGLESHGFSVVEASNGLDALKKAAQCQFDLIVLDVMMPQMDGLSACRLLKQNNVRTLTPIIMLSADASSQNSKNGYEAGADIFIKKPVSQKVLIEAIDQLLSAYIVPDSMSITID